MSATVEFPVQTILRWFESSALPASEIAASSPCRRRQRMGPRTPLKSRVRAAAALPRCCSSRLPVAVHPASSPKLKVVPDFT
ncbi:hypothetical protein AAHA92_14331 [Salvia divinorum]|uniref:Uncharacterized protein n=1 Tax=Salvia divinorum TaxID=28513 RepID=A0ABD1HB79_SALDI